MLATQDVVATIAVTNLEAASKFYEDKLGLKLAGPQKPGARSYQSGNSKLFLYESQFAGTNKATAVTWTVDEDVEKLVSHLAAKGVVFEHYEMPQVTRKGDVHYAAGLKMAWLKDPDGNILALVSNKGN